MYNDRLCPGCMNDNHGERICSICGYDMASKNDAYCLPVKFLLSERYVIGKVLSVNGEGITYIAWDNASDTAVHVKEYFPKGIAARNPDKTVTVIAGNEFYFNEGLLDFVEINRRLVATEMQAIIPVLTVFEDNGTVYAVNPITPSITLQSFLNRNGGSLRWEQVRPLFLPLIDTLGSLHDMGIIHGGISPETIMVGRDGKLRLAGICIPRLRMASAYAPAELYTGYAAVEQYGKVEASLNVASDVYALSAVLFRVLIGTVPPASEMRLQKDTLSIPARFADELPRQVLVAIANGMQVNVQNRTSSVDVFKNELVYGETPENLRRAANTRAAEQRAKQQTDEPDDKKGSGIKYAIISAGVTVAVCLIIVLILNLTGVLDKLLGKEKESEPKKDNSSQASEKSEPDESEESTPVDDTAILYPVPNLIERHYYEIIEDEKCKYFEIIIKGKEYSEDIDRGLVCVQSIDVGETVASGTKIYVTISLGPEKITMESILGCTQEEAKYKLIDMGFLSENIKIEEVYDESKDPNVIIDQEPAIGEQVSTEEFVVLYFNTYKGDTEDTSGDGETANENV